MELAALTQPSSFFVCKRVLLGAKCVSLGDIEFHQNEKRKKNIFNYFFWLACFAAGKLVVSASKEKPAVAPAIPAASTSFAV